MYLECCFDASIVSNVLSQSEITIDLELKIDRVCAIASRNSSYSYAC